MRKYLPATEIHYTVYATYHISFITSDGVTIGVLCIETEEALKPGWLELRSARKLS